MNHARISWLRPGTLALCAVLGHPCALPPALAADVEELVIELNKLEDSEEGCRSLFVFDNGTGRQLNRFRVDLILFDREGVYAKELLLDMAPLYEDKKVLASFLLGEEPCAAIGSILVNDLPQCEDGAGTSIDCLPLLRVLSRAAVPLEK